MGAVTSNRCEIFQAERRHGAPDPLTCRDSQDAGGLGSEKQHHFWNIT